MFGSIAGEEAVKYAKENKAGAINEDIDKYAEELEAPMKLDEGLSVTDVEFKLRAKISQYLTPPKSDPLMKKLLWWIERIEREDIPRIKVDDYHDLIKVTEVKSILRCAEMAAKASLFRTESRWGLGHFRLAYPYRDPNWEHKQVVISKGGDQMELKAVKVPEHKWHFAEKLEYEYPEIKMNIGTGYTPKENPHYDPWIAEKVGREGFEIPKRIIPGGNK